MTRLQLLLFLVSLTLNRVFASVEIHKNISLVDGRVLALTPSFVEAHAGETLDALVRKLHEKNIAVCLTVTPMFGKGGLSSIMARRHIPITYAVAHSPHIKYNFAAIGSEKRQIHDLHNTSEFINIFKQQEGAGCKLDGNDGRKMSKDICLVGKNASVGHLTLEKDAVLLDGDTLTVCQLPIGVRDPLFDFRATRSAFMRAYWENDHVTPHPDFLDDARRSKNLVISVHFRNGDSSYGFGTHLLANRIRYVPASRYFDLLSVIARLPKGCAQVFFVSEFSDDKETKQAKNWFRRISKNRTPLKVVDATVCNGPCGLAMMTHADVLIGANSGFSIFAAVLAKESTIVSFVDFTFTGEDEYHIGLWRDRHHQTGHPGLVDGALELEAALRRKLPPECALLDD